MPWQHLVLVMVSYIGTVVVDGKTLALDCGQKVRKPENLSLCGTLPAVIRRQSKMYLSANKAIDWNITSCPRGFISFVSILCLCMNKDNDVLPVETLWRARTVNRSFAFRLWLARY